MYDLNQKNLEFLKEDHRKVSGIVLAPNDKIVSLSIIDNNKSKDNGKNQKLINLK